MESMVFNFVIPNADVTSVNFILVKYNSTIWFYDKSSFRQVYDFSVFIPERLSIQDEIIDNVAIIWNFSILRY